MESKRFVVYNKDRQTTLSPSAASVNAALEPLKVLKVLIEGLPASARTGLWLTNFKGVPVARTLSPFDLVYLDKENRVLHGVELSKDGEFAPFRGRPASALVLPSNSLKGSGTREGDLLELNAIAEENPAAESVTGTAPESPVEIPPLPAPVEQSAPAPSPGARLFSPPSPPIIPSASEASPPLEQGANQASLGDTKPVAPLQPVPAPAQPAPRAPALEPPTAQDFFTPTHRLAEPAPPASFSAPPVQELPKVPEPVPIPSPDSSLQISQPSKRVPEVAAPELLPIREAPAPAEPARTWGPPQKQKFSWKVRLLRWLFPHLVIQEGSGPVDRRRADRQSLPGLVAYFFTGGSPEPQRISNISVTGFYLQTDERWMPGTVVRMTLQRLGTKGDDPADTITVNSRIVRWGSDGEGFEFILTDLEE